MGLLITSDVFGSSWSERPKINFMKSKLETKDPRFQIKFIFNVKTDNFEGSTAPGRRQNKVRYLFWVQN